ncbi:MAG TPA: PIN domain-containing protein, partial [Acidimicrobiales bacterium]|nr:PIN domain-containing protein [Acidimicrobiales bacterium]
MSQRGPVDHVPCTGIERRTYVLDTSVLLSEPRALTGFAEHEVVVPLVVLTELEDKRHHPELGWAARTALRTLEGFRTRHGSLTEP